MRNLARILSYSLYLTFSSFLKSFIAFSAQCYPFSSHERAPYWQARGQIQGPNNRASGETNYTHDPRENYHVSAQIGCHASTPQHTMRLVRAQRWTLVKCKKAAAITLSTSRNKITWSWAPLPLTGNLSEWFFNLGYNDQSTSSSESLKVYQTTRSSRGHNCYWWDWKASCWVRSMWNWYYFDNYSQSPLIPEAPRWWGLPKTSQKSRAPWYWAYNMALRSYLKSLGQWWSTCLSHKKRKASSRSARLLH